MSADRVLSRDSSPLTEPPPAPWAGLPAGCWQLLPADSSVRFRVLNWGVVTVQGSVPVVQGHVQLSAAGTVERVEAELALDRLDTQNARRDRDLAKPALLDLARYPTLTFNGGPLALEAIDAGSLHPPTGELSLSGTVSAHGASVPVTLSIRLERPAVGQVLVRASTELDRRELGIRAPRLMIGRRIRIDLSARFELRS